MWAIAVIAGFNLTAIVANYALFDVSIPDPMNIWNMIAIAIAVVVVRATRSVVKGAATITYGIWLGLYMWTFVPSAY